MAQQDGPKTRRSAAASKSRRTKGLKKLAQTTVKELNRLLRNSRATGGVGPPPGVDALRIQPVTDAHVDAHSDYHSDAHGDFHADTHGDRALVIDVLES